MYKTVIVLISAIMMMGCVKENARTYAKRNVSVYSTEISLEDGNSGKSSSKNKPLWKESFPVLKLNGTIKNNGSKKLSSVTVSAYVIAMGLSGTQKQTRVYNLEPQKEQNVEFKWPQLFLSCTVSALTQNTTQAQVFMEVVDAKWAKKVN